MIHNLDYSHRTISELVEQLLHMASDLAFEHREVGQLLCLHLFSDLP
jgi:hypothetical protein